MNNHSEPELHYDTVDYVCMYCMHTSESECVCVSVFQHHSGPVTEHLCEALGHQGKKKAPSQATV